MTKDGTTRRTIDRTTQRQQDANVIFSLEIFSTQLVFSRKSSFHFLIISILVKTAFEIPPLVWFSSVVFDGISTLFGYLKPDPIYTFTNSHTQTQTDRHIFIFHEL